MEPVIFFDGVCNLCNWSVDFVIRRDSGKTFKYSSLQSAYARQALAGKGIDLGSMQSIVLIKDNQVYTQSDAVLEIARGLRFPWPLFYPLRMIPRFIRDGLYRWISKNRYRWFGKESTCRVPTPEERSVFLEDADPIPAPRS
jgi:predicted DCC family thiol-disulfide oxidoreductase YuxK